MNDKMTITTDGVVSNTEVKPKERNDVWEFVDSILKIHEIKRGLHFLDFILPSPVERTVEIVNTNESPAGNPYKFMEFGITLSTLIYGFLGLFTNESIDSGLFSERFAFMEGVFTNLLFILSTLIGAACSFYIIRAITKSEREFKKYLRIIAVLTGIQGIVSSIIILALVLVSEQIFLLVSAVGLISLFVISIKIYQRFWGLPYSKLVAYNLIAAIPATIFLMIVYILFVMIFMPMMV